MSSPPPTAAETLRKVRREISARSFMSPLRDAGRTFDRRANPRVGSATAQYARHRGIDVGVGWLRIFCEQRGSGHDLARLAVTALRHVQRDPCLLRRMVTPRREPFDSGDFLAGDGGDRRNTGAHR